MSCPAGFTFDTESRRKAPFAAITESLKPGEQFNYWGNAITWTDNHIPASKLEPLRKIGDELADDALEILKAKPGQDALELLREYTARPENEQESPAPRKLMEHLVTVPEWVDWEQIRRGQEVYWRYCLFISHALLHYSLAGGFAIPNISKVLSSTGYLSGKKTKERVLETSQFVLDVVHSVEYLLPGTGAAWESIVQVRLLHANVRSRLSRISRAHSKYYNVEEHGVPINQEDLLGTLFSFSNVMWRVMDEKMDVNMTKQEREDYLHLWRYIGYMMGVDDVLNAAISPERADACLESIILHLADPDTESGRLCEALLKNMAPKPTILHKITKAIGFLPDPFKIHMALAEQLLGPEVWEINGLPKMTRPYRVFRQVIMYFLYFDLWLITKSSWWFGLRSPLIQGGHYKYIERVIGKRRSQFALKEVPKDGSQFPGESEVVTDECSMGIRTWSKMLTTASAAIGVALVLSQRTY
ncbi:hypothetical protein BGZ51_000006 [Haplosporangium sp. Z 767]|nr:hypothetical protein BGZ51_000006 [Haplosporangium sp. Z 767]